MHEFLLFSQVSASRKEQVLNILAGVTGLQPVGIREQHLIYQQLKVADTSAPRKGAAKITPVQPQRPSYQKLVRDVTGSENERNTPPGWRLIADEMPEPGVKNAISRVASDTSLPESEMEKFRPGSQWYKYVNQYVAIGDRFVHGNVVIRITRVMISTQPPPDEVLDAAAPPLESLQPLDPSSSYLLEAYVRADDGTNSKLRDLAVEELLAFSKAVEGAVDLRIPDRLALDTRVKGS